VDVYCRVECNTTSTTATTPVTGGYGLRNRRALFLDEDEEEDPVKEDYSLAEVLGIIEKYERVGASADATVSGGIMVPSQFALLESHLISLQSTTSCRNEQFSTRHELISKKSCDALVGFVDESLESDLALEKRLPFGQGSHGA